MIEMWIPASAGMTKSGAGCGFPRAGTGTRPYDYGQGQATVPVRGNHGGCRYECG